MLNYARTLKFATVQARLRARIGRLPDAAIWRALTRDPGAAPMDGLTGIGLGFWLEGLSQYPSTSELERHLNSRVRVLLERVASWLPSEWTDFAARLTLAPDIFWVAPILSGHEHGTRLDHDSLLKPLVRAAPEQRQKLLEQGPFAEYVKASDRPETTWRVELAASIPRLPAGERQPVERLLRLLNESLEHKYRAYERLDSELGNDPESSPAARGEWRFHRELEQKLYTLLAGDPFHPALILIYGLLELLTMEKLRALLLSRLLGWPPPAELKA